MFLYFTKRFLCVDLIYRREFIFCRLSYFTLYDITINRNLCVEVKIVRGFRKSFLKTHEERGSMFWSKFGKSLLTQFNILTVYFLTWTFRWDFIEDLHNDIYFLRYINKHLCEILNLNQIVSLLTNLIRKSSEFMYSFHKHAPYTNIHVLILLLCNTR